MTSSSPMPWIKLYTEILDDTKFGTLPDALKWRFTELCLLAGECDAEGYLVNGDEPLSITDIAWRLRRNADDLLADLDILSQRGFIVFEEDAWLVVSFAKRQDRPQHEKRKAWRERKRRQREREAEEEQGPPPLEEPVTDEECPDEIPIDNPVISHEGVTRDSRPGHASREEESREEKSRMGPAVAGSDSPGGPSPPAQRGLTEGQRYWLTAFGAKRFANTVQKEAVLALERTHGTDVLKAGVNWAAKQGMSMGKAVTSLETALPKWGIPKGGNSDVIKVTGL